MARGVPLVETCPTCRVEFIGSWQRRNGQGSWRKVCPAGHWHTLNELSRTRNAARQDVRDDLLARTGSVGIKTDIEAMRLALAAMLGGYQRLLATTPERSRAVIDGAFGKSAVIAQQILDGL